VKSIRKQLVSRGFKGLRDARGAFREKTRVNWLEGDGEWVGS
jgi:hypothetical protein